MGCCMAAMQLHRHLTPLAANMFVYQAPWACWSHILILCDVIIVLKPWLRESSSSSPCSVGYLNAKHQLVWWIASVLAFDNGILNYSFYHEMSSPLLWRADYKKTYIFACFNESIFEESHYQTVLCDGMSYQLMIAWAQQFTISSLAWQKMISHT